MDKVVKEVTDSHHESVLSLIFEYMTIQDLSDILECEADEKADILEEMTFTILEKWWPEHYLRWTHED